MWRSYKSGVLKGYTSVLSLGRHCQAAALLIVRWVGLSAASALVERVLPVRWHGGCRDPEFLGTLAHARLLASIAVVRSLMQTCGRGQAR